MELAVAKAGVRTMDALQAFSEGLPSGRIERFGITGYSKYGSATWTLGAIGDPRIKAIAPAAIPLDMRTVPKAKSGANGTKKPRFSLSRFLPKIIRDLIDGPTPNVRMRPHPHIDHEVVDLNATAEVVNVDYRA